MQSHLHQPVRMFQHLKQKVMVAVGVVMAVRQQWAVAVGVALEVALAAEAAVEVVVRSLVLYALHHALG